jgi:branched-chain amino acid transport system ATP-binding protein
MPDLRIRGLRAWYGEAQALRGIDLDVPEGTAVGLLGRNGAGKTTTLRAIARAHGKVAGQLEFGDTNLLPLEPHLVARLGVSLVGETAPVYGKMTVAENLGLAAQLGRRRGAPARPPTAVTAVWEWFPALESLRSHPAASLSGGQRRMLALGAAFYSAPKLLLLDEPSGGLSDDIAVAVFEAIAGFCAGGVTALIAEQRPELLARFIPSSYLLDEGLVVEPDRKDEPHARDVRQNR